MGAADDVKRSGVIPQLVADCRDLLKCDPRHLVDVAFNESGFYTRACHPEAFASGLWQFVPPTALAVGWDPRDCVELRDESGKRLGITAYGTPPLARFRELDARGQWMWFRRFFRTSAGKMPSRAAIYVKCFLPADLALAADPTAVLSQDPKRFKDARRGFAYPQNRGFDLDKDGQILVGEIDRKAEMAAAGPRHEAVSALVHEEMGLPPPPPKPIDLGTPLGAQKALNRIANAGLAEDGFWGPASAAALRRFQKTYGLNPDGLYGPQSRAALGVALARFGP